MRKIGQTRDSKIDDDDGDDDHNDHDDDHDDHDVDVMVDVCLLFLFF